MFDSYRYGLRARKKVVVFAGGLLLVSLLGLTLATCGSESGPPASTLVPAVSQSPGFDLDYARLSGPLGELSGADRDTVRDTIELIKQGEHTLALNRLSSLNQSNPQNSSLHILASYALLQAGNLVSAFGEAEKAHATPDRTSYKCWFLAKVAMLNGNKSVSEREVHHVEGAGDMVAQAKELEREYAQRFGSEQARP